MSRGGKAAREGVEGCSLLWTGKHEPLAVVADVLRRSGVRLRRVDEKLRMIHGRVGSWASPRACKVSVRLYPFREMSLVEMSCRGSRIGPGRELLCCYLDTLKKNMEGLMPLDVSCLIDWEREDFGAERKVRVSTDAVALLKRSEVGPE